MEIVRLPKTDTLSTEFTIIKWLKKEGQRVKAREALVEVEGPVTFFGGETRSMVLTLIAETHGTLLKVFARAGNMVPPGAGIACVVTLGEEVPLSDKESYLTPHPEEEPVPLHTWYHQTPEEVAASDARFLRRARYVLFVLVSTLAIMVVYAILHPSPGSLEGLVYASCYFSLMALFWWNKKTRRHFSKTLEIILFWLLLSCVAAQALLHFLFHVG